MNLSSTRSFWNSRTALYGLFSFFLASLAVETCEAQLFFRRRREQMKAEMKWELEQELNANLDSQVKSARTDLSQSATEQIQTEAAALRETLKQEIAAMRSEADRIVADEKERIARETAKQIAQIQETARQQVEKVGKELQVSTMTSIAKAEQQLKAALDNYSKMLGNENARNLVQFEEKTSQKFESLKGELVKLINEDVSKEVETAIQRRVADSNKQMEEQVKKLIEQALAKQAKPPKQPGNKKKKPKEEKNAILNRVPRVIEDSNEEGDA